jgi:hypothetical protein
VTRGEVLLYQVRVDKRLEIKVDPKKPRKGRSAFQTDIAVFEQVDPAIRIPRVVMEFKTSVTIHDLLTYNAKAVLHKQIYPYLRYGMVASSDPRLATHQPHPAQGRLKHDRHAMPAAGAAMQPHPQRASMRNRRDWSVKGEARGRLERDGLAGQGSVASVMRDRGSPRGAGQGWNPPG